MSEFQDEFQQIKIKHDKAYTIIDEAIRDEENEDKISAIANYKRGIDIIDEALSMPVSVPDVDSESGREKWTKACQIIHKMKRTRAEVLQRIGALSVSSKEEESSRSSTAENVNVATSSRPRTYSELAQALREMQCTGVGVNNLELLFSCENVKLYHIKANGSVTTTTESSTLRIVRLDGDRDRMINSTYFIQIIPTATALNIVGETLEDHNRAENAAITIPSTSSSVQSAYNCFVDQSDISWIYPLVPGVSPCYRTDKGAFILPDLQSDEYGSSFGIVVSTDDAADQIVLEILEAILHGVVTQKTEGAGIPYGTPRLSRRISEQLVRGAEFASGKLVQGAHKAGEMISYSTPYIISKIPKAPPNVAPVSQTVHTSVHVAKTVTGAAAGVTGFIAGKVGSATMALGRFLAPHIQKHGSTMLSKGLGINQVDAQEKMSGVLSIAAGAVEGFGTVYAGLEQSASILGKNLGTNSVKVIEHRYGPSAGSLAAGTFDTVGNVINLSQNVNYITPKGIVKRTAKNAGKAIVEDYKPNMNKENMIPASSIYPRLDNLPTIKKD